jgi:hypothetical protein
MRKLFHALPVAFLGLAGSFGALTITPTHAAAPTKAARSILHVTQQYKNDSRFAHVTASAKVRFGKQDTYITLETDNLPSPHVLHEMAYVLWVVNGGQKVNVGVLRIHANMAGLTTETMLHKVQDLAVTAEESPTVRSPHGPVVLSGMVG